MFLYIDLQKFDFPLVYGDEQVSVSAILLEYVSSNYEIIYCHN